MKKLADSAIVTRWVKEFDLHGFLSGRTMDHLELFSYGKGEVVCSDGGRLRHLLLLVSGKLKLYKLVPGGRSILIRFYRPLSVVGDLELLHGTPVNCNVESVGTSQIIAIPLEALRETELYDPRFLRFIIHHLSSKLLTISNASTLNVLYPLENRLASYLVSITGEGAARGEMEEIRTPKLTEVAELLGTSYRHLNRVLSQFEARGLLERRRGSVCVRDLGQLKRLAEGNLYQ